MMFASFFILFLFTFIRGSEEKQALIFDRFTRSLFQLPNKVPTDLECGAWAVACPAETHIEEDFIREYSFTKNALFVRELYDRGGKAFEVKKDVCKNSFKISLVYNVKSTTFQVGFELYHDLKDDGYFHINNFEDYKSTEKVASAVATLWKTTKFVGKEFYRILKNIIGSDPKELWINRNKRMGFTWIYLIKFDFDFSERILKKLVYNIGPNSRWPVNAEVCEDYSLGFEFYKDVEQDIYNREGDTMLKHYSFPGVNNPCKSNKECFRRWSLVPISQFRFGTSTAPLCSKLTTIPLWTSLNLEFALKKVDQYLYALYRAVNEPLHIIAGTTGQVEFPKRRGFGKSKVFLDPDKKIFPMPKIIYKIVEYRVKDCKLEEKSCWYSAVIVIHNDPMFKSADRICSEESTKDWGWDDLMEESNGMTYVCPRDKYTKFKLLGIPLRKIPITSGDLKLTWFPKSKDGKTIEPEDIRNEIKQKLVQFRRNGDELNINELNPLIELNYLGNIQSPEHKEFFEEGEEAKDETGNQISGEAATK